MTDNGDRKTEYRKSVLTKIGIIMVCVIVLIILAGVSCVWETDADVITSLEYIWRHINGATYTPGTLEWWTDHYIWENIMPSVVVSVIAGCGLAIGGAVMQSITKNPLADAYTTGISSGACFGAVMVIVLGATIGLAVSTTNTVIFAFVGALIPAGLIMVLTKRSGTSPVTLILLGIAVSYFFNGLTTYMMVTTSADSLQSAYNWQIGSVTRTGWSEIAIMFIVVSVASVLTMMLASKLNLMSAGDANAKSLGLNVERFRVVCMVFISVLTASIIAFTGIIGFVGLISPHIARLIIGNNNKFVIPMAMAIGALFVVFANMVSHSITFSGGTVPVGVIMSFIGAPIFLFLIITNKKGRGVY
jgi:iron complex transport system permease protein